MWKGPWLVGGSPDHASVAPTSAGTSCTPGPVRRSGQPWHPYYLLCPLSRPTGPPGTTPTLSIPSIGQYAQYVHQPQHASSPRWPLWGDSGMESSRPAILAVGLPKGQESIHWSPRIPYKGKHRSGCGGFFLGCHFFAFPPFVQLSVDLFKDTAPKTCEARNLQTVSIYDLPCANPLPGFPLDFAQGLSWRRWIYEEDATHS
mmetsp:Transcript_41146/g.73758  ORF Transcript_41146/g.73758 Transcript_41146/m.73758 type:complete len:202 (+) Transcript_41146:125-730(+)